MSETPAPASPNVRAARPEDLPGISQIHNEVVASSNAIFSELPETPETRRAWFQERTAAGMAVLVAVSGAEILGFASYGPFRPWAGYRETVEQTVHVRSDSRRMGVGRALLGVLIEDAREREMHAIMAGIDGGNEPSIALHRAFGFVEVGLLPEVALKHGTRLDLLLMQLLLNPRGR
jgi:L-amino acid N-acyltransferase YncA